MSDVAKILFSASDIRRRVRQLGRQIAGDYAGRSPVLISVLKGGTVFLCDLIRQIPLPVRVDFMSISAYAEASESSGVVRIMKDLDQPIGGEDVIVVEDIVDTGLTLSYLLSALRERTPASIEVCTLLDRTARRIPVIPVRYQGFECPDRFVVGYGLDFQERYRNLPDILEVLDLGALQEDPDALVPFLHGEPPRLAG
ncbi:MAG TPA: hypoxanthine phosphoribosyltransferase [Actinomycetota bacterium]